MQIEWDKEDNIIKVGEATFNRYVQYKDSKAWALYILSKHQIYPAPYPKKTQNKEIADALKGSRTQLFAHFNALQKKVFIAPVYEIIKKIAYSRNMWAANNIARINQNKDILLQAYKDKQYNILPILNYTGESPKDLKAKYKNVWKNVTSNSLRKNIAIAKVISTRSEEETIKIFASNLPSTLLRMKEINYLNVDAIQYLANNFKGEWNNKHKMITEGRYFQEMAKMAKDQGKDVSTKWSVRRVKEEHDKLVVTANKKKYSTVPFIHLKDFKVKQIEHEGYVATLLESPYDIYAEGSYMGHCVGMYSSYVASDNYLVYSVTKNGERSSTIGINITKHERDVETVTGTEAIKTNHYTLQQQYGRFNKTVTDVHEKEIANLLVSQL
jgi:hypothetical protein